MTKLMTPREFWDKLWNEDSAILRSPQPERHFTFAQAYADHVLAAERAQLEREIWRLRKLSQQQKRYEAVEVLTALQVNCGFNTIKEPK